MSDNWEKIQDDSNGDNSEVWEAKKGDKITGVYKGYEEIAKTNSRLHLLDTEDGKIKVWGSKVLDGKLEEVENGTKVMIKYKGKVKSKSSQFKYKDYEVWKAKN